MERGWDEKVWKSRADGLKIPARVVAFSLGMFAAKFSPSPLTSELLLVI
jgi:hypothetical protein